MGKRRVPPRCVHPYKTLSIIATGAVRGQAQTIRVSCQACGSRVAGNEGVVLFVIGMRDEMAALRKAIRGLGGNLDDPAMGPDPAAKGKRRPQDAKASCSHYLAWLDIAGEGRPAARGRRTTSTVKCRNCGQTWGDHTNLLMIMKGEVSALWLEVRRLGGERPPQ